MATDARRGEISRETPQTDLCETSGVDWTRDAVVRDLEASTSTDTNAAGRNRALVAVPAPPTLVARPLQPGPYAVALGGAGPGDERRGRGRGHGRSGRGDERRGRGHGHGHGAGLGLGLRHACARGAFAGARRG